MVTGVILAGGLATRLGGTDKGLIVYRGRPLIEWVIERIAPQVDELLINANRNAQRYSAYGYRVVADVIADFPGPLAGMHAALLTAAHDWVLSVPCDCPNLPSDLAERLMRPAVESDLEMVVAATKDSWQPAIAAQRRALAAELAHRIALGHLRARDWIASRRHTVVTFDDEKAFRNVNTIEDF